MELRPYQQAAIDALYSYFAVESGNPLIVCPTAAGKSIINAAFIKSVFELYPQSNQRIMVLSHVKELIQQDANKIKLLWPNCPMGVYSAGLNKREIIFPITVASIQSVYKKAHLFNYVSLIIIDEAHLMGQKDDTMYRSFINELKKYNPNIKIIGLTATPFKMKGGMLTYGENRIFTDIAYEITLDYLLGDNPEAKQYISRLVSKVSKTQADLTGVKTTGGDYNQKEAAEILDQNWLTEAALDEVFRECENRRSWLFFCASVEHAIHVRDALRNRGVTAETVSEKTPPEERARILADFVAGKIQAVTNMAILTTGFDAPCIDLIVSLRGTKSLGLWMQMLGRGMRLLGSTIEESIANGKKDCKILDFAGNMERFGPINFIDVKNPKPRIPKECPICFTLNDGHAVRCIDCGYVFSEAPKKSCPECHCELHAATRICKGRIYECQDCVSENGFLFGYEPEECWNCESPMIEFTQKQCAYEFPDIEATHRTFAAEGVIIAELTGPKDEYIVNRIEYTTHSKFGKPDSLKVSYFCNQEGFNIPHIFHEWICLEHESIAKMKAVRWWIGRAPAGSHVPQSVFEALKKVCDLKEPAKITARKNGDFWEVSSVVEWKPQTKPGEGVNPVTIQPTAQSRLPWAR